MNYISLYIKRTFTRNFKKQLFLILGIAAFMASLSMNIMIRDSNQNGWENYLDGTDWGFSYKVHNVSDAMIEYFMTNEKVERVDVLQKFELTGGISEAKWVVSSAVPETWKMNLLYGRLPEEGEILLTDRAVISGHQPILGETVRLEVKIGGEKRQFDVKVSGVVEANFTEEYIFLNEKNFDLICTEGIHGKHDLFFRHVNEDPDMLNEIFFEMREKFGGQMIEGRVQHFEYEWGKVLEGILLSIFIGGACLGGIIYIVLLDEKKNVGILRALGAKKVQIAAAISARVMVTGGLGVFLGCVVNLFIREFEKNVFEGRSATGEFAGIVSVVLIPTVGLLILLLAQIPGLFVLLKETPINQMMDVVKTGDNLISYKNSGIFRVKHPIWWFSGLEGKRLRGRSVVLVLMTVLGLILPMTSLLNLEIAFQSNEITAVQQTYTIEKVSGTLGIDEVTEILRMEGVQSAGFRAEQMGTGIAEYEGEPLNVRIQILDENSLERLILHEEKSGEVMTVESENEFLRKDGVVIQPMLLANNKKLEQGNGITLLSPEGERFERTVTYVTQFGGEVDADYYVFIGYDSYCEIFGVPELQNISVTLNGTTMKEVTERLKRDMQGMSIEKDEILLGYSEEQLNYEEVISTGSVVVIMLLTTVAFLFCYNSFFYLSKTEQYRKLYVIGASKKMIKNSVLFQALRMSGWLVVLNTVGTYMIYRNIVKESGLTIRNKVSAVPIVGVVGVILLVVAISMSSAWFASKQVLRELEQKA